MTARRSAGVSLALLAACSGTRLAPHGPAKASLAEPVSFVSPARWDHHPTGPTSVLATVKLADGSCLLTSEGGQRWMAAGAGAGQAPASGACGGKATTSDVVATEDLVSAIRRGDGAWVFVGDTGTVFEAAEPLGPFTRVVPAPEPFVKVAGAGSALLATTLEGKLLRWEASGGWAPVSTSPALRGVRVFDVAMADGNRAMALGFPEVALTSEDGGASWSVLAGGPIGARVLGRTAGGDLAAQGMFESLVFHPRGTSGPARGTEKLRSKETSVDVQVGRAPSATAVLAGRAVLDGDRYYEVVPGEGEDGASLARGRIEGRQELLPIPGSKACSNLRLGAVGKTVYLVCTSTVDGQTGAELRRSVDAGSTWGEPFKLATLDTDPVEVAASSEGSVLVTGVCKSGGEAGCKPVGPVLVRFEGASPAATASTAPQLSGPARLPAFSLDGRSAYFLGRRGKDDRISLFVSHDGGESFSSRTLEASHIVRPPEPPAEDDGSGAVTDGEPQEQPEGPDYFDIDESSSLRPGEDGGIGMMLMQGRGGYVYVTADPDGRVLLAAGMPAKEATAMAGFGRRVIALSAAELRPLPEGVGGTVWESIDGGATWEEQHGPYALAREYARGNPTLACSYAGCLIGETLTRVGWGGKEAPATADKPEPAAPTRAPALLTPISCELAPSTKWTRLDNVDTHELPTALPLGHVVMRGRSAWSVLTHDPRTGALAAVSATLPEAGDGEARIVTHPLFAAHPPAQRMALYVSTSQVEGYAAVRVPVPVDAKGAFKPGAVMRHAEVAWENYFEAQSQRARLPDAGPFARDDVGGGSLEALQLQQLSISNRALIVRPHHGASAGFFVDGTGKVTPYQPHPWPAVSAVGTRLDIRATTGAPGGEPIDEALLRDRSNTWIAAASARRAQAGGPVTLAAASLLPDRVDNLVTSSTWAVAAKAPVGLIGQVVDTLHNRAWAHFLGLRADGSFLPAEALPTPFDLGDRPRPCSVTERAGARFQASSFVGQVPLFPGTRHPVLVSEPRRKNAVGFEEPLALLTRDSILHGTPASPCVAGWEAAGVARARISAVLSGNLARSWIFRIAGDPAPGKGSRPGAPTAEAIEYRPMTCRFDPTARVPEAMWTEPGAFKIER